MDLWGLEDGPAREFVKARLVRLHNPMFRAAG